MPDGTIPHQDQAVELRRMVGSRRRGVRGLSGLRSMAVLSGKGGVGKSNLAVNLAVAMVRAGKRVVLLDADLGMANVDLLCGVSPKFNLSHLVRGQKSLDEVLTPLANGVLLLPGGAGVQGLADLDDNDLSLLIDKLSAVEKIADILLIDAGAGIHRNTLSFGVAADMTILVTSPEPTSIRDAYGVLKTLTISTGGKMEVTLVVNMAASHAEGKQIAERIQMAAHQFLSISVAYGGTVVVDDSVGKAVRSCVPLLLSHPNSPAARDISSVASKLVMLEETEPPSGRGVKSFFFRLARSLGLGG